MIWINRCKQTKNFEDKRLSTTGVQTLQAKELLICKRAFSENLSWRMKSPAVIGSCGSLHRHTMAGSISEREWSDGSRYHHVWSCTQHESAGSCIPAESFSIYSGWRNVFVPLINRLSRKDFHDEKEFDNEKKPDDRNKRADKNLPNNWTWWTASDAKNIEDKHLEVCLRNCTNSFRQSLYCSCDVLS
jgi:hypothetical protein